MQIAQTDRIWDLILIFVLSWFKKSTSNVGVYEGRWYNEGNRVRGGSVSILSLSLALYLLGQCVRGETSRSSKLWSSWRQRKVAHSQFPIPPVIFKSAFTFSDINQINYTVQSTPLGKGFVMLCSFMIWFRPREKGTNVLGKMGKSL